MTAIPPCPDCSATRVITRDAIGHPRIRCRQCQGVNLTRPAPGTIGHLHRQTALDSRSLAWDACTAPPCTSRARPSRGPARRAS